MNINQKGFASIPLIVFVVLSGVAGYFVLDNSRIKSKPTTLNITNEQPTLNISNEEQKPTVISEQPVKKEQSPTKSVKDDTPIVTNETPVNWQFIDANLFTLSLPSNWKFNKLQGTDSYVGEFVGDGIKLSFDFGWYSSRLAEDGDPNYVVTYETIGGYRAKIVEPKVVGSGITGIYFGDLGNQNRFNLYGNDISSSQKETVLKIFRTIKFKK